MSRITLAPQVVGDAAVHTHGISFYRNVCRCPRRALSDDGSEDSAFGTACHAWLARYHGERIEDDAYPTVPSDRDGLPDLDTADLLRAYRQRLGAAAFGTRLLTESRLVGVRTVRGLTIPVQGTLDAVDTIDAASAAALRALTGVAVPPGDYLVDIKTKKQRPQFIHEMMATDEQFTLYWDLWRQATGRELTGILVNVLVRTKTPQFDLILLPPPGEMAFAALDEVLWQGWTRHTTLPADWADPTHCWDWMRRCPLLDSCTRSNG